jgi:hypothetical protein
VVELLSRALAVLPTGGDDTRAVVLERISVDSDGERTVVNEPSLHGGLRSGVGARDAGNVGKRNVQLHTVHVAGASLSGVGIGSLSGQTTPGLDISHSSPRPATVATLVANGSVASDVGASVRAVNNSLLREEDLLVLLDDVLGLDVTGGGEGPARTALTLILNGGNLTLSSPIEGGGEGLNREALLGDTVGEARLDDNLAESGAGALEAGHTGEGGAELLLSQVRELVDGEAGADLGLDGLLVHASDTGLGRAVVVEASVMLVESSIHLVMLDLVHLEL